MNTEAVNKYRKRHRRCKTCAYAREDIAGRYCVAKQSRHFGSVFDTVIAGKFCNLYIPFLLKEDVSNV